MGECDELYLFLTCNVMSCDLLLIGLRCMRSCKKNFIFAASLMLEYFFDPCISSPKTVDFDVVNSR